MVFLCVDARVSCSQKALAQRSDELDAATAGYISAAAHSVETARCGRLLVNIRVLHTLMPRVTH